MSQVDRYASISITANTDITADLFCHDHPGWSASAEGYLSEVIGRAEAHLREAHGSLAPDPAPVFVIRASDLFADDTIRRYYDQCVENGLTDLAAEVLAARTEMRGWQMRHRDQVRLPGEAHPS